MGEGEGKKKIFPPITDYLHKFNVGRWMSCSGKELKSSSLFSARISPRYYLHAQSHLTCRMISSIGMNLVIRSYGHSRASFKLHLLLGIPYVCW